MLHILNTYNFIRQLFLSKTGEKRKEINTATSSNVMLVKSLQKL